MSAQTSLKNVTRLLVTYNSADILDYSVMEAHQIKTLAVDNASSDNSVSTARSLDYAVLPLEANIGYSNAIMAGLQKVETDFVLITNPDVQISINAIQGMLAAAEKHSDCCLFVPRIFRPNGSEFFRHETRFDKRVKDRTAPQNDQEVSTVSGAVLLIRKDPFIRHGGFDTNIFLYFEDDELSLRFRTMKQPMRFVAAAEAKHIGDASSNEAVTINRIKDVSFGWSWGYLMKKMHLGNRWITLLTIFAKLLTYSITFRSNRIRRQLGILEGFIRNLLGQPAPFLRQ